MKSVLMLLIYPVLLAGAFFILAGCGGPELDNGEEDQGLVPDDAGEDLDAGDDVSNPDDAGEPPGDAGRDSGTKADGGKADGGKSDGGKPSDGGVDAGGKDGGGIKDGGLKDGGGVQDSGLSDGGFQGFCRSWNDCFGDDLCDFALGRCDRRATWKETGTELFSYHPPAGTSGDVLIIDGKTFSAFMVSTKIGSTSVSTTQFDENRILVKVPQGASGKISVTTGGKTVSFSDALETAPTGVIDCDGTTPDATGIAGTQVGDTGPYAAGYVDFPDVDTRVFYPADCGSIRRPSIKGTFPIVALLHGNGAQHIDYEYLGGLLATWGFVSFMTLSEMLQEYNQEVTQKLYDIISKFRGKDLSSLHPALYGIVTTARIFFVGHSRGCMRTQNVLHDFADVKSDTVGSAFLGPADEDYVMPGPFLVIGASMDVDSLPFLTDAAYNRQSAPRWKVMINGGNHGMFCDHRVYSIDLKAPKITRREHLATVISFVLPMIQRAFDLEEPFASQLDSPPSSPIYTVTFDK
jgi:hypothetical protein